MLDDQRRDVGVVNEIADGPTCSSDALEMPAMRRTFPQHCQGGRIENRVEIVERHLEVRGGIENTRMGDNAEKLVHTRPGDGPGALSLGQGYQKVQRVGMPARLTSARIDEDIRVERDHRRPSMTSQRASRSSSWTPGRSRPRSGRHRSLYAAPRGRGRAR